MQSLPFLNQRRVNFPAAPSYHALHSIYFFYLSPTRLSFFLRFFSLFLFSLLQSILYCDTLKETPRLTSVSSSSTFMGSLAPSRYSVFFISLKAVSLKSDKLPEIFKACGLTYENYANHIGRVVVIEELREERREKSRTDELCEISCDFTRLICRILISRVAKRITILISVVCRAHNG